MTNSSRPPTPSIRPSFDDAEGWLKLAREAGAKYWGVVGEDSFDDVCPEEGPMLHAIQLASEMRHRYELAALAFEKRSHASETRTSGFRQVLPLPPQPETITTSTDDKPVPVIEAVVGPNHLVKIDDGQSVHVRTAREWLDMARRELSGHASATETSLGRVLSITRQGSSVGEIIGCTIKTEDGQTVRFERACSDRGEKGCAYPTDREEKGAHEHK